MQESSAVQNDPIAPFPAIIAIAACNRLQCYKVVTAFCRLLNLQALLFTRCYKDYFGENPTGFLKRKKTPVTSYNCLFIDSI